jgi:flavodoxin
MTCDLCDREVGQDYELQVYGNPEVETGYQDHNLVCYSCLGLDGDTDDDERYAEADRQFTAQFEEAA